MEQVHIRNPAKQFDAYPHQLSGGMLQRVLIAMAVSTDADLIVADEPTSALDVTVQAGILDLLLELQEQTGIALLLITHDLGVARLMSDRIHVMKSGVFVESGPVTDVVDHPQHPYTQKLLGAIPELGAWEDPAAATRDEGTPTGTDPAPRAPIGSRRRPMADNLLTVQPRRRVQHAARTPSAPSTTCRSASPAAAPSRSSASPAVASRRSPRRSSGCSSRRRASSTSTAPTWPR